MAEDPYLPPPPPPSPIVAATAAPDAPHARNGVRPRGSVRGTLAAVITAFLLGGGTVGVLAWRGDIARVLPSRAATPIAVAPAPTQDVSAVETRLALLEDRFSRLDQQAAEAAGNAGKAERLLIAQATRRAIERGRPLGYLAEQLRLRFADAQPRAVETLIAFAQRPVTLDTLDAQLDVLTPQLAELPHETTSWERMRSALANLLTIRSDATPVQLPQQRIDRVKLLLASNNIDAATQAISRLPGGRVASQWTIDARRYSAAQQALDVLEGAAIEPPPRLSQSATPPR